MGTAGLCYAPRRFESTKGATSKSCGRAHTRRRRAWSATDARGRGRHLRKTRGGSDPGRQSPSCAIRCPRRTETRGGCICACAAFAKTCETAIHRCPSTRVSERGQGRRSGEADTQLTLKRLGEVRTYQSIVMTWSSPRSSIVVCERKLMQA